jgi:hypothetical protein
MFSRLSILNYRLLDLFNKFDSSFDSKKCANIVKFNSILNIFINKGSHNKKNYLA